MIVPITSSGLWLMFCYEYTVKKEVSRFSYILFPTVIILFILGLYNPYNIVYSVDPYSGKDLIPADPNTIRFILNIIFGYGFVLLGTGMLIVNISKTTSQIRSKQSLIIVLLSIFGMIMSILKVLSFEFQIEPMIFGILVFNISIAIATNVYEFSKIDYLDKNEILDNYNDIVISCNQNGDIIYMNNFAKQKLGKQNNKNINDLIEENSDQYIKFKEIKNSYYSMDMYEINESQDVYSFSNITDLIIKTEQINLWNDISDRVLRHNVKNEINVVEGYSDILVDVLDKEEQEFARKIRTNAQSIKSTTNKLRDIEDVIHGDKSIIKCSDKIKECIKKSPDEIEVELNVSSESKVRSNENFDTIISEIISNAVEHNNSENKILEVNIDETEDYVILDFDDNGVGISDYEYNVIDSETEDEHKHSSGCGLWMIKMFVLRSDAKLDIEDTEDGTKIRIYLPKMASINK
jgi:two-component sensor histidine kinase